MKQYINQLQYILENGVEEVDRTGVGTISVFGTHAKYDLREGFPLVTTKDMSGIRWKGIVAELLWFLSGDTNSNTLESQGVNIWKAWKDENGELGPIYGHQMRNFGQYMQKTYLKDGEQTIYFSPGHVRGFDQISWLINEIKTNPKSRRLLVSHWNPYQVKNAALPPCHYAWQINISGEWMDLQFQMRSNDAFLGQPFNIASYALLLSMIAEQTGYYPRYLIQNVGNHHIYLNHLEQVKIQIEREPFPLPKLLIRPGVKDIFSYTLDDFELVGYQHHPKLVGKVAV